MPNSKNKAALHKPAVRVAAGLEAVVRAAVALGVVDELSFEELQTFAQNAGNGDLDSDVVDPILDAVLACDQDPKQKLLVISELTRILLPWVVFRYGQELKVRQILRQLLAQDPRPSSEFLPIPLVLPSDHDLSLAFDVPIYSVAGPNPDAVYPWKNLNMAFLNEWEHRAAQDSPEAAVAKQLATLHQALHHAVICKSTDIQTGRLRKNRQTVNTVRVWDLPRRQAHHAQHLALRQHIPKDFLEGLDVLFAGLLKFENTS